MFTRRNPDAKKAYVAPMRDTQQPEKRRSVLLEGTTIKGEWTSDGIVDFSGTLIGDLTVDTLILGPSGTIIGNVKARIVTIEGTLEGTVSSNILVIKTTAKLKADINVQTVTVETGAEVDGHISCKS